MGFLSSTKKIFIGKGIDPLDPTVYHKLTLIAFFAWVGLGSDGLSSSCYGPPEVMASLNGHFPLGLFVGLGTVFTIFIISSSYSQIIELFPSGGGGYLVASKLLSPKLGMLSGCALLIDYALTITVSLASGTDAFFSFLPPYMQQFKLIFALFLVVFLIVLNLRGVKESVIVLLPIFLIFVASHIFVIAYSIFTHYSVLPQVIASSGNELHATRSQIGLFATFLVMIHAYSMGAGTYTGIEAVSNSVSILREPRVKTAKITMRYMAFSLSITVFGLMLAYLLFNVGIPYGGKTLNAIMFEKMVQSWNPLFGTTFVIITLVSEAAILFVAAQTGFLGGPRILANMAHDRWVPQRFATLSDRLVTQNGIILMGGAAFILMLATNGSVTFLLVLYSINVFLTFVLSQLGMVKHWWQVRKEERKWKKKLFINGIGLILTLFILITVTLVKFYEGGWITLIITGSLVAVVLLVKNHYKKTGNLLKQLDALPADIMATQTDMDESEAKVPVYDRNGRTAVLLVNGFRGIGLHSLMSIFKLFGETFSNFAFVQVGIIDAGVFKGVDEIDELRQKSLEEANKFVDFMKSHGYYAEAFTSVGLEVVEEVMKLVPDITKRFPRCVFFGGQIVFPRESIFTRFLHNYTVFSIQRKLYNLGIQFVILPIKLRLGETSA